MLETTVAEILQPRWLGLEDNLAGPRGWCGVNKRHIYCCVRPEAILHHPIENGALFPFNGSTYEVCMVDHVCPAEGENWMLIYAHLKEDAVAMTKEEWNALYGDPDLASGSGLDKGSARDDRHCLWVSREMETGER